MATQPEPEQGAPPEAKGAAGETVLVVDDSRAQRRILASSLGRWGYSVIEAGSGAEALDLCEAQAIDLVVSDWVMPGMSGLEFCRLFRERRAGRYGYFVLLTSKSEKLDIARGLDVGADDFLTKPVNAAEFRARIRAGERILKMERQLTEKNRIISGSFDKISALYEMLDRDLLEARRLQQSLVRDRHRSFGAADVSLLLRPSGRVGGDLVGFFPANDHCIGFHAIDVSGHGIAAALLGARLAAHFSGGPGTNLALVAGPEGGSSPRSPAAVAQHLNTLMLREIETDHYFTMLLGHLDLRSGKAVMVQCGHPHPTLQRAGGGIEMLGDGGLPVGLISDALWQDFTVQLRPGDRLLLPSDGVTELPDADGVMLEDDGLHRIMRENRDLRGKPFLQTLVWNLANHAGEIDFPDDVSAVLVDFNGTGTAA